ncbi:MAG: tetratricopeptide repeat-containing sensor histidine kinase [Flavobacteriales bacterium]|nr:tetratricopeptide repeat-containing sensor histidine kinase [Flavobacteriales bacterium]
MKTVSILVVLLCSVSALAQSNTLQERAEEAWQVGDHLRFVEMVDSLETKGFHGEEMAAYLLKKGKSFMHLDKPVRAIQTFNSVPYHTTDPELLGESSYYAGEIYFGQNSYTKALEYYASSLQYFEEADNHDEAVNARFKTAIIHSRSGEAEMAETLLKMLIDDPSIDDMRRAVAIEELGVVYFNIAEFDSSRKYLEAANEIYVSYDMDDERLENYEWLMRTYQAEQDNAGARAVAAEAVEVAENLDSPNQSAFFLQRLADLFKRNRDIRQAIIYQEKAAEFMGGLSAADAIEVHFRLADLYAIGNRDADALLAFHDAEGLAVIENEVFWQERIARRKAEFFQKRNRFEEAYVALAFADSISLFNHKAEISALKRASGSSKFNPEPYARVETDTRTQHEESRFARMRNIIIIGLVFFTIVIFLLLREFSQKRKLSKVLEWKVYKRTRELRKANKELNTYIYKSSHDLRTPLTSIKSLLRLLEKEEHNASTKKYLGLIASCSDQMDDILVNLSRAVDYKKVDIKVEQIDFNKLKYQLQEKELVGVQGIRMLWDIEENGAFFSDFKLMKVILQQTIQNAISYRKGTPEDYCKISIVTDSDGAKLQIEDNGLGIAEKVRDKVFDMFVKGTHKSTGAGLGLYLVKIASEKIRAKIHLDSEENQGCTVVFDLPNLN